ncbi:MAG: M42 family metallopeptidase [Caldisericia bacterium]|nr:M42 family metallopeptidase [Caldisericia bacterium]
MFDWERVLKTITSLYGISGEELSVANWIQKEISPFVQKTYINTLGSLVAIKEGVGKIKGKLMISTHIDEIGFVVGAILDGGFLKVEPRGGVDPKILQAQECLVRSINGEMLPSVFSTVPPHLIKPEERNKVASYDTLILDTGLSEEDVKKRIRIGSPIVFKAPFISLLNNRFSSKTLDDRACATISIATIKELTKIYHEWDIYFVFSTQEEVGLKGAGTSAWEINPDVAIAMDVGFASQEGYVGLSLGEGPGLAVGPNFTPKIVKDIRDVAKNESIPLPIEPSARPGGTDAGAIQVSRGGVPTALISIPIKYMHTPIELLDLKDCKYTVRILTEYIKNLDTEYLEGLKWS